LPIGSAYRRPHRAAGRRGRARMRCTGCGHPRRPRRPSAVAPGRQRWAGGGAPIVNLPLRRDRDSQSIFTVLSAERLTARHASHLTGSPRCRRLCTTAAAAADAFAAVPGAASPRFFGMGMLRFFGIAVRRASVFSTVATSLRTWCTLWVTEPRAEAAPTTYTLRVVPQRIRCALCRNALCQRIRSALCRHAC
jgi:hypothetical protein